MYATMRGWSIIESTMEPAMHEIRKALRQRSLATRDRLSPEERGQKSRVITERLLALPEFAAAGSVFIFVSFRSEVETMPLIRQCLAMGKQVSVPLTLAGEHRLLAFAIRDPEQDLAPGYCGIPEPRPGLPPVAPSAIEAAVVPGSVFSPDGGRLGYGGGYYDRFLQNEAPQALRVGLAFELQLVEALPLAEHDQPMDCLITETRLIHAGRKTP